MTTQLCLSVELTLTLHTRACGGAGLRDRGALEAALAAPNQCVFGTVSYPTPYERAAKLLEGIARHHPFIDGNKRTALLCAVVYLDQLGIHVSHTSSSLGQLVCEVAEGHHDIPTIATYLKEISSQNSEPP